MHVDVVCDRIRQDYANFPKAQSYELYAADVYFQDPLNRFRGVERYRDMVGFIERWFQKPKLELHALEQLAADHIQTQWTLSWIAPFPWQPSMAIAGWTDYRLDDTGKVASHIDHWHCSRWSVLGQALGIKSDR